MVALPLSFYALAMSAVMDWAAAQDTCPFGADYSGRPVGDITVYQEEPVSGNCNMDIARLKAGSKGWTHFAALPKYTAGGYQGGREE